MVPYSPRAQRRSPALGIPYPVCGGAGNDACVLDPTTERREAGERGHPGWGVQKWLGHPAGDAPGRLEAIAIVIKRSRIDSRKRACAPGQYQAGTKS
jgi:hypothetical protein